MPTFYNDVDGKLEAVLENLLTAQAATTDSNSYTGTLSAMTKKRNLEEGGFFPDFDATIDLKASDFSSAPVAGQQLTEQFASCPFQQ